jgi:hypothetical protein
VYWTVPNATTGDIGEWKNLSQSDVPEARTGATPAVIGSWVYMIGGTGGSSNGTGTLRANTAPQTPFFQLGLVGATIPGLGVKGDVGQNFGYLNAAGVGTVDFILLILVGLAYSHRQKTRQVLERVSRGRYRAPREDEYFS